LKPGAIRGTTIMAIIRRFMTSPYSTLLPLPRQLTGLFLMLLMLAKV
jgi:hypothetical protein